MRENNEKAGNSEKTNGKILGKRLLFRHKTKKHKSTKMIF